MVPPPPPQGSSKATVTSYTYKGVAHPNCPRLHYERSVVSSVLAYTTELWYLIQEQKD